MIQMNVEIDDQAIQQALETLLQRSQNLNDPLEDIGEMLIVSTQKRFETKTAPDGTPWADNSALTQAIKTLNDPLIGESRRLGNEIHYRTSGNSLEWGSPLEYAGMQQFGGSQAEFPHLWGDIPARPFLGLSDDDKQGILEILTDYLAESLE